jgi:3-deoxy-D-manno-octulosonic-acid transferase
MSLPAPGRWAAAAARALYVGLLTLLLPLAFARLAWRGRREAGYRAAWGERLGRSRPPSPDWQGCVWLHAVSLGETRAARPLIDSLLARHGDLKLLLTHGTATGREAGAQVAAAHPGRVAQTWLPFDLPWAQRRWLAAWRPALGVLMETEVWPELLAQAERLRVPVVLANARMSERSARGYLRFGVLMRPAFARLARVLAQSDDDAQRLRALGAPRVQTVGSVKFDLRPDSGQLERGRLLRARLGRPVLLAAATRAGEEALLLDAFQAAWAAAGAVRPLLLIVPRHPQRFDAVAEAIAARGLRCVRRAGFDQPTEALADADVLLGDSMGELAYYYGLADVAVMGGSLLDFGSQNFIEACACGCPVLLGPSRYNFQHAADAALAEGAVLGCRDAADALAQAGALLLPTDEAGAQRAALAAAALRFAASHRGATERHLEVLLGLLDGAAAPSADGRA